MRKSLLTALCFTVATAPLAFAQEQDATQEEQGDQADQGAASESAEGEGAEVVDQPQGDQIRTTPPPTAGAKDAAPGEVHTVVKGDTLWDLSQRYLGSPWYWPKVWSYNPEVANPHWIYPGNLIRFFAAGEEVPSRVEAGTAPTDEEQPDVAAPESMDGEEGAVRSGGKIGYGMRPNIRVHRQAFVTKGEVEESGTIVASFAEQTMLSYPDTAYVKFKRPADARVGDEYLIFHTEREVFHPESGAKLGYLTRIDGVSKVVAVDKNVATILITKSYEDVRIGQKLAPPGEKLNDALAPRPNDRELKGVVVTTLEPELTILGEHQYIVIDRGTSDGVNSGNLFTIVRHATANFINPSKDQDKNLPLETVGLCLAVDVKDKTSTCLISRSIREIVIGDRVEMRSQTRTASR